MTATSTASPTEIADVPEDAAGYLSGTTLRELGSCDSYVRRLDQLFPADRYPQGGEVTAETCAANYDQFDWSWAVEVLLKRDAQREYHNRSGYESPAYRALATELAALEVVYHARRNWLQDRERTQRNDGVESGDRTYPLTWDDADTVNAPAVPRRVENPPTGGDDGTAVEAPFADVATTRRAANDAVETWYRDARRPVDEKLAQLGPRTFGELFEDAANRSDRYDAARRAARRRVRQRALDRVNTVQANLDYARSEIERLRRATEQTIASLPDLERQLAEARVAAAPHLRAEAADVAAEAAERLERHRRVAEAEEARLAEEADAAAAALATVEEELRTAESGDASSEPTGN